MRKTGARIVERQYQMSRSFPSASKLMYKALVTLLIHVMVQKRLHCPRCGFLWMALVGIGETGVS